MPLGSSPRPLLAAVAALALACPAAVADVNDLYDEYRAFGLVRSCAHSEDELREGLAQIPPDVRAYDPGFADALNTALERRAAECGGAAGDDEPVEVEGAPASDGSPGPPRPPAGEAVPTDAAVAGYDGWLQAALPAASVGAALLAFALAAGLRPARRRSRA